MVSLGISLTESSDPRIGEAVILESTLLSMRRPSKRTFEAFYNVFHNVDSPGEPFPTLGGPSAKVLDDRDDLMALHRPAEEDRLTMVIRQHFPWLFRVSVLSKATLNEADIMSRLSTL